MLLLTSFGLLTGCFTEAGNPDDEDSMTARILIDGAAGPDTGGPAAAIIEEMSLRFTGAAYRDADSAEHPLWADRAGSALDFAGGDSLLRQTLAGGSPRSMTVGLRADSIARVIRGTYTLEGTTRAFLYEVPDTLDFNIGYDSTALAVWSSEGVYACRLVFRARMWLSVAGLDTATVGMETGEDSVVVFNAAFNPDLHIALTRRLPYAFNGARDYTAGQATD